MRINVYAEELPDDRRCVVYHLPRGLLQSVEGTGGTEMTDPKIEALAEALWTEGQRAFHAVSVEAGSKQRRLAAIDAIESLLTRRRTDRDVLGQVIDHFDCESCGCEILGDKGSYLCNGCHLTVCCECVNVFGHIDDGAHETGNPADEIDRLRAALAEREPAPSDRELAEELLQAFHSARIQPFGIDSVLAILTRRRTERDDAVRKLVDRFEPRLRLLGTVASRHDLHTSPADDCLICWPDEVANELIAGADSIRTALARLDAVEEKG